MSTSVQFFINFLHQFFGSFKLYQEVSLGHYQIGLGYQVDCCFLYVSLVYPLRRSKLHGALVVFHSDMMTLVMGAKSFYFTCDKKEVVISG